MDQVISFGKYKGRSFSQILEEEPGYAKWALTTLKGSWGKNQRAFCEFLKENFKEEDPKDDKILKNAWYCDPRAEKLLKYGLDPKISEYNPSAIDQLKYCSVDEITPRQYLQKLDEDLVTNWLGSLREIQAMRTELIIFHLFYFRISDCNTTKKYYVKPDIANTALSLLDLYNENLEDDREYESVDQPSRIITDNWLTPANVKINVKDHTGVWYLPFDNRKEDEKTLTELDRAYQTLKDNYEDVTTDYRFFCSTRKPNSRATDNRRGVIVVRCCEDDRDEIISRIDDLLELSSRVYWYRSAEFKENEVPKGSKHYYDPKLRIQREEVKQIGIVRTIPLEAPDVALTECANGSFPVYMRYSYKRDIFYEDYKNSDDEFTRASGCTCRPGFKGCGHLCPVCD